MRPETLLTIKIHIIATLLNGRGRDSKRGEGDDMHLLEGESWVAAWGRDV